jgi:hypothetical protein
MKPSIRLLFLSALCLVAVSGRTAEKASVGTGPSFKGPIGLQLYSLREFTTNIEATLPKVATTSTWSGKPAPTIFRGKFRKCSSNK